MAINKIIKYNLESRASELKNENNSFISISEILSSETTHKITASSVQRYFKSIELDQVRLVEKNDKLKAKVVEAEINTINECLNCIVTLKDICDVAKKAGNTKDAIQAIDKIYTGLDMLNKVQGKYPAGGPQVQFNFQEVNVDATRDKITSRINSIASRIGP